MEVRPLPFIGRHWLIQLWEDASFLKSPWKPANRNIHRLQMDSHHLGQHFKSDFNLFSQRPSVQSGCSLWVLLGAGWLCLFQLCWPVCRDFVKESTFTHIICPSSPYLFSGFSRKPSCAHWFQDHVVRGCHWGRVVEHLASQYWPASHRPQSHALSVWAAEPWTNYLPVLDFSLFIDGMRPRLTFSASQQGLSGISIHSKFSGREEGILVASVCQRVTSFIKYFPAVWGQSYLESLITTGLEAKVLFNLEVQY